ncbi:MAG: hypothetical protein V1882_07765 [Candidatus Omnitrophota bacterium]
MNLKKNMPWKIALWALGLCVLWLLQVLTVRADGDMEDVKVVERKPDPSNPAYEIITVEGGLTFRSPKDMTFVKQYGIIGPVSTEEYCLKKIDRVDARIDALTQRVEALEAKEGKTPEGKN